MANFKRKKSKSQRAGCLRCKPHKATGNKKRNFSSGNLTSQGSVHRSKTWRQEYLGHMSEIEQISEYYEDLE